VQRSSRFSQLTGTDDLHLVLRDPTNLSTKSFDEAQVGFFALELGETGKFRNYLSQAFLHVQ
jgi:hypothetical protein